MISKLSMSVSSVSVLKLKTIHNIKQQETVYSVAWNPVDHNRFALAGDDKQIEIW